MITNTRKNAWNSSLNIFICIFPPPASMMIPQQMYDGGDVLDILWRSPVPVTVCWTTTVTLIAGQCPPVLPCPRTSSSYIHHHSNHNYNRWYYNRCMRVEMSLQSTVPVNACVTTSDSDSWSVSAFVQVNVLLCPSSYVLVTAAWCFTKAMADNSLQNSSITMMASSWLWSSNLMKQWHGLISNTKHETRFCWMSL